MPFGFANASPPPPELESAIVPVECTTGCTKPPVDPVFDNVPVTLINGALAGAAEVVTLRPMPLGMLFSARGPFTLNVNWLFQAELNESMYAFVPEGIVMFEVVPNSVPPPKSPCWITSAPTQL